jgi:hypothetical protein
MEHTERMRAALRGKRVTAMFGGVCFMLGEHMLCAARPRGYLFRVGKERSAAALSRPGVREWLSLAQEYVATLPPKRRRR